METERNWNGDGERQESSTGRTIKDRAATQAHEAKEQMRSLADAGREEFANQLEGFAEAFSDAGESLRSREQGTAGRYTELIGEQARTASRYFRERDADALIYETESFARRQPLLFLGGCVLAGFAIGRFLHASPPAPRLEAGTGEGRAMVPRPETTPVATVPVEEGPPVETAPVQPVGERPEGTNPWNGGDR